MADRFLIAPLKSGLIKALPAWQIPEDAFAELYNAYVFRGRVTKRCGTELMNSSAGTISGDTLRSRLRIKVGTTNGSGNLSGTVPGSVFSVGQQFSIALTPATDEVFTVNTAGTPAVMLTTGASTVHTFNTSTGAFVINGSTPTTDVYWYPGQPVMGITTYEEGPINNQDSFAFDTQFAYNYLTTGWERMPTGLWHGNSYNYFWSSNWQDDPDQTILYTTNYQVTNPSGASVATDDPLWYWDGSNWFPLTGSAIFAFLPNNGPHDSSPYVFTARIIMPFKGRLVLLNTIENDNSGATKGQPGFGQNKQYVNRCRYSFAGSPLAINAWYETGEDNAGNAYAGGGVLDAPTKEAIISAEFIKDRLIVYFEQSTWELAYTGSQSDPFVWQQINTELGAIGTFSIVPFDRAVLGIGDTGVHSCSGANVERIDDAIPDEIFEISKKNDNQLRIAGVRDYFSELVYWSFVSVDLDDQNTGQFPDKILVYNYSNNTWAIWDDTYTAFGYFWKNSDVTWASLTDEWQNYDISWSSGVQYSQQRRVLAGNQQGYMVLITRDQDYNAFSYTISDIQYASSYASNGNLILTVVNHNMNSGDFVAILDVDGMDGVGGIYKISQVTGVNTFTIIQTDVTGGYLGRGVLSRVSRVDIWSKQWNPYISKGRSLFLSFIDFAVRKTDLSEITVDYYSSSSQLSSIQAAQATNSLLGNNVLETRPYASRTFEEYQELLWHRIYFQMDGQFIQIRLYWTDAQMTNPGISLADFTLEGLVLSTQPTSYSLEF